MKKVNTFTKVLAVMGSLLVWFPVLAPVLLTLVRAAGGGPLMFDYLMPGELFPLAAVGAVLLIWAAARMKQHVRLIAGSFAAAVALLLGGLAVAAATGLAGGEIEPSGWPWMVTLLMLNGYSVMLLVLGVEGILLLQQLFGPRMLIHSS